MTLKKEVVLKANELAQSCKDVSLTMEAFVELVEKHPLGCDGSSPECDYSLFNDAKVPEAIAMALSKAEEFIDISIEANLLARSFLDETLIDIGWQELEARIKGIEDALTKKDMFKVAILTGALSNALEKSFLIDLTEASLLANVFNDVSNAINLFAEDLKK